MDRHTNRGSRPNAPCALLLNAAGAFLLVASHALSVSAQSAQYAADREPPSSPSAAEHSPWDEDWSVTAGAGVGAPTGLFGAELERRIASWISVRAGAGYGASGVQGAAMMHLHLPSNRTVSLGAGISAGPFRPLDTSLHLCIWDPCSEPAYARWDLALWNNYELSFEFRGETGYLFRGFLGGAVLLNRGSFTCVNCGSGESPDRPGALPYVGFTVGRAFS